MDAGVGLRPGGNLIKYKSNPDPRTLGQGFCSLGASQRREAGKGSDGQWLVSPLCEAMTDSSTLLCSIFKLEPCRTLATATCSQHGFRLRGVSRNPTDPSLVTCPLCWRLRCRSLRSISRRASTRSSCTKLLILKLEPAVLVLEQLQLIKLCRQLVSHLIPEAIVRLSSLASFLTGMSCVFMGGWASL